MIPVVIPAERPPTTEEPPPGDVFGRISAVAENGKYFFVREEGKEPLDDRFAYQTSLDRPLTDPTVRVGARVVFTPIIGRANAAGEKKGNGLAAVNVRLR